MENVQNIQLLQLFFLTLFPLTSSNHYYFSLYYSIYKSGLGMLIKHRTEFWNVSKSLPHPDEYLEAGCYHGYPARLESSVASAGTRLEKMALKQVTLGLINYAAIRSLSFYHLLVNTYILLYKSFHVGLGILQASISDVYFKCTLSHY